MEPEAGPSPPWHAPSVHGSPGLWPRFGDPLPPGAEEPWVIFSNAAFVGRPETGMRYYNSRQDSKVAVYDHYTGVGEVLAIHALDEAFGTLGRRILVKRGSLFTLDDVKNNNLIFVGSPSENLSLLDIPGTQEFVFQRVASGPRQGDLSIVNKHPKPGEASDLSCQSFECPADGRLFGRRTSAGNRSGPVRDDSGGNDHVRDARRGGVCLPPGVGGEIAACDSGL